LNLTHILDGLSFYFPDRVLTNAELSKDFFVSEEKIFKNSGVLNRFISAENETATDMAVAAITNFFEQHNVQRSSIDFLLFSTGCPDFISPASSCIVQHRTGLPTSIGAMDVPHGCSGYLYGLALAKSLIHCGMASSILLVTADTSTKTIPDSSLELRSLFSDVASVTHINKENYAVLGEFVFGTDGAGVNDLYVAKSGFREPVTAADIADNMPYGTLKMDGIKVFNFGLREVPKLIQEVLKKNRLSEEDIDLFVFHQPSGFMLETLRKKLAIAPEKFLINIDKYGNTVASTIPLGLYDARSDGRLQPGMNVLIAGFGVGYSWAGTIIKV
jgi:3-oxoacyl-[acyl-carrier-protein] synthase III